jgi:hypothetical protein
VVIRGFLNSNPDQTLCGGGAQLVFDSSYLWKGRKRGTTAPIKAAFFAKGPNVKKCVQVFMINCLDIIPVIVYEPNAIEAIHLAVISNSE